MDICHDGVHSVACAYQAEVSAGISIASFRLFCPRVFSDQYSCNRGCFNFLRMALLISGVFSRTGSVLHVD